MHMTAPLRHASTGLATLLTGLSTVACGIEPGSGGCTETVISAPPVTVTDRLAPLSLRSTLTTEDGPVVPGAELAYFIRVAKLTTSSAVGVRVGEATTGPDGVADFVRNDGVDGVGFSDERAVGYTVEYNPLTRIDGVQYCRSRSSNTLTVIS